MSKQEYRDGDWTCCLCSNHNFRSRDFCNQCAEPRKLVAKVGEESPQVRAGDWICMFCDNKNFASRSSCHKCNSPKEMADLKNQAPPSTKTGGGGGGFGGSGGGGSGGGGGMGQGMMSQGMQGGMMSQGMQGAMMSNLLATTPGMTPELMAAITAGHAQGGNMQASLAALQAYQAALSGSYGVGGGGGGGYPSMPVQRAPASTPSFSPGGGSSGGRPGDWLCKSCGNNNFAFRDKCHRCNLDKQEDTAPIQQSSFGGMGGLQQSSGGGSSNSRPGDWTCNSCSNNNFAFRTECHRCKEPKGSGGGDGKALKRTLDDDVQPGSKPPKMVKAGDWTCSKCSNYNYAFRTQCKQCNAAKEDPAPTESGEATYVPEEAANNF